MSLLKNRSSAPTLEPSFALPQLSAYEIARPTSEKIQEIVLSGTIDNHRRGIPLGVLITFPDGQSQNFAANLSNNGNYRSLISINSNSLTGRYDIHLSYNGAFVGSTSFQILNPEIPVWVKNNAKWWYANQISDEDFIKSVQYLVKKG